MKQSLILGVLCCLSIAVCIFFAVDAAETTKVHLFIPQVSNSLAGLFFAFASMCGFGAFISLMAYGPDIS